MRLILYTIAFMIISLMHTNYCLAAAVTQNRNAAPSVIYLSYEADHIGKVHSLVQEQTATGLTERLYVNPQEFEPAFYTNWITPFLAGYRQSRTVQIQYVDYTGKVVSAYNTSALLQRVEFPELNAARKDEYILSFTYSGQGSYAITSQNLLHKHGAKTQKVTAPAVNGFKFIIEGIETRYVQKIDPIVVMADAQPTGVRNAKESSPVRVSGLVVTMPLSHAQGFQAWLSSASNQAKRGAIQLLSSNFLSVWATLNLDGIRITKITHTSTPGSSQPTAKVEMTVSRVSLSL